VLVVGQIMSQETVEPGRACDEARRGWNIVSVELDRLFNWLFLALTILAFLFLLSICALRESMLRAV
jgi:hypothetical protein